MSSGFYLLHRGWFDNHHFKQKTLCERAAWIWLIEHACWKPKKIRLNGKYITLERGQLTYSRRYIAKSWYWHESRVQRFLNDLEIGQAIGQASEQGQRIITICNYDKYQVIEKNSNQQTNQQQDSERTSSEPNKKERNKRNKSNQSSEDDEILGNLFTRGTILKAGSLCHKWGIYGDLEELGLEMEMHFLRENKQELRNPPAAFLSWIDKCWLPQWGKSR